jgi:ABC-type antimicrobial peptide transport system permease subunit
VRSKDAGSTAELIAAIGKIAHELDPTVPVSRADSLQGIVDASIAELVLMLQLLSGAALITLLLGNLGLYGAMAYMVTLRGREFGIRVALGAGPGHIIRLVASRGVGLAVVGMLAGLGLYALLAPYLRNLLYGVESYDPPTLITATLILSLTAAAASWLPARDAARTAPMVALKRD